MRLFAAAFVALTFPWGALSEEPAATARADALLDALSMPEVMAILREEGLRHAGDVEDDMFPGSGGESWDSAIAEIYAEDRLMPEFRKVFGTALAATGGDVAAMTAFFTTDPGRKAVALEVSARRAFLDPAVEDASKLKVGEMRAEADPRLELVGEFILRGDLVEANVTSGLNANLAFYQGLADGGALPEEMTGEDILREVWSQEDSVRSDTTDWLFAFLTLAYAPLSDDELRDYIAFSASEPGQDLNRALFEGFDAVFLDVSHRLGVATAAHVAGQDL
ncbi:MAG: hypothetical protein ACKVPY_00135 [Paracoccaceae bacterium]